MSVKLEKASDKSPYGGHNSRTSYTKQPNGKVPEYILTARRYNNGGRVSFDWGHFLLGNDPVALQLFYKGESIG